MLALPWLCSLLLAKGISLSLCQQDRGGGVQSLLETPEKHGFTASDFDGEVRIQLEEALSRERESTACETACALLSALYHSSVHHSTSPTYPPLPYWSVQQTLTLPTCRIDISSPEQISTTLKIARLTTCPFAVRSGGHAPSSGTSSISGTGILINLSPLSSTTLTGTPPSSPDQPPQYTAHVGPGADWHSVYTALQPHSLAVVGGREAGVGVGGLVLGGGISYFSGRHGWACDNVRNFEVVLSSGEIVNANRTSHPELFWALRGGGGSNLGIVSRFDLVAFEQGELWGGTRLYDMSVNASLAEAVVRFGNEEGQGGGDEWAHLYIAYVNAGGRYLGVSGPAYGKPISDAPVFEELNSIPALVDMTSVASMAQLSVELNQTAYLRQVFRTVTFKIDVSLVKRATEIFVEETDKILHVRGLAPAFAFQPVTKGVMRLMGKEGGNALGLDPEKGPLMIMNLNFGWETEEDDAVVYEAVGRFVERCVEVAKESGLDEEFVYMNYAGGEADIYKGYGKRSLKRLKKVRKQYDPEGVFKKLWPGGFKLN